MASHENNLGILSVEVTTVCETWVRLLLRHVTLERSLLLLERVQLRNPVDDVRVLVDLAARHPLSLELRLLGHDVLLQRWFQHCTQWRRMIPRFGERSLL